MTNKDTFSATKGFLVGKFHSIRGYFVNIRNQETKQLEAIYVTAITKGRFSLKDSFKAPFHAFRFVIHTIEYPFIWALVFMIFFLTDAFDVTADKILVPKSIFWLSFFSLGMLASYVCYMLVTPFQFLFGISYIIIHTIHVFLTTVCIVEISIYHWGWFGDPRFDPPSGLFPPILVLMGIGTFVIILVTYKRTNFIHYKKMHSEKTLELLIPMEKRGDFISITAQDHYVLISTMAGEHLLRMSLSEAISKLPESTGIKVHRSHWVANSSVLKLIKSGNKTTVKLTDGKEIPVSANKIDAVSALVR